MTYTARIMVGDARERLRELSSESVRCVVTSPPYWGLRDYGTARWEGGAADCDHSASKPTRTARSRESSGLEGSTETIHASHTYRGDCGRCGARRVDGQIGLEATPADYVASLVAVFAEVRRVLRDDGTLWLNLGDSYASNAGGYDETGSRGATSMPSISAGTMAAVRKGSGRRPPDGLKPKDLVGIPWSVAFALRTDGWYLRSDIIWHKPNPMPESVTDRPKKSHEYLFLLAKSERYYYDAEAIAEAIAEASVERYAYAFGGGKAVALVEADAAGVGNRTRPVGDRECPSTRNRRTVWTVPTHPFHGAHFATFPPSLIEPCVIAGCPVGGVVLDPFSGAGTTGMVALRLQRSYIGIELNPEYAAMSERRIRDDAPLLNAVSVEAA